MKADSVPAHFSLTILLLKPVLYVLLSMFFFFFLSRNNPHVNKVTVNNVRSRENFFKYMGGEMWYQLKVCLGFQKTQCNKLYKHKTNKNRVDLSSISLYFKLS